MGPIYLAMITTINISATSYISSPAGLGAAPRMRGFGMSIGTAIGRIRAAMWGFGPPVTLFSRAAARAFGGLV